MKKMWIPILPRFSIYTGIKNNIYRLFIEVNKKKLLFSWSNFGENATISLPLIPNRSISKSYYIYKPQKNINPNLLGLNINDINISRLLENFII